MNNISLTDLKKVNQEIDIFFDQYNWLLENKVNYFSVEDYMEYFEEILKKKSQHYSYHYPLKIEVLNEFKDRHLISYQPAGEKQGFLSSLFQISKELHLITKVGCEFKNNKPLMGVNLLFVSFGGLNLVNDFIKKYEPYINHDVFAETNLNNSLFGN